jgi:hypothetical protein
MRQNHTCNLSTLRNTHSKHWHNFLQQSNARQPPSHPCPSQGSYPPPNAFTDLTDPRNNSQNLGPSGVPPVGGGGPQSMYPYGVDGGNTYSSAPRPHDGYGNAYGRY